MKGLKKISMGFVIIVWLILFSAEFGLAATLYVSPTEGIYNDINSAIAAALPGDEIVVRPGTYPAVYVDKEVHIRSEKGPEVTKIIGAGEYGVRFVASGSNSSISGFYIKGVSYGVSLYQLSAANIEVKNNIIEGSGLYGVYFYTIDRNTEFINIENNVINGNGNHGIYLRGSHQCCGTNLFRNLSINNNIISDHNEYGILFNNAGRFALGDNSYLNNIIFGNLLGTTSNVTVLFSDGNLFNDPLFVDASTGNYMLQATSPAIDAGRVGAAFNDPDGSRNNIGVYGGPGAASFWPYPVSGPVVTDLSVFPASVPQGGTITIKATGSVR